MSYASGGLIQAADYNSLTWGGTQGVYTASPNNIAYVMGVGNSAFGYGQDVSAINTVSSSALVTATQWSGLLNTLNKALGHQSGAGAQVTVSPAITTGNVITYFSSISANVTTINTNAALFAAQGSTVTGSTNNWNPSAAATVALNAFVDTNVTFASAQHARYFFNAGGQINFVCSAVDNAGTTRSISVRDTVNNIGGLSAFRNTTNGGRTGSGGTLITNNTAFGYRNNVFNSATTIVQINDDVPYGGGYAILQCFSQNNDTTNGANGNSFVFRLAVFSPADDAFGGSINVTISTRADIVYPESTYLTTNSWGTPTISFDNV